MPNPGDIVSFANCPCCGSSSSPSSSGSSGVSVFCPICNNINFNLTIGLVNLNGCSTINFPRCANVAGTFLLTQICDGGCIWQGPPIIVCNPTVPLQWTLEISGVVMGVYSWLLFLSNSTVCGEISGTCDGFSTQTASCDLTGVVWSQSLLFPSCCNEDNTTIVVTAA